MDMAGRAGRGNKWADPLTYWLAGSAMRCVAGRNGMGAGCVASFTLPVALSDLGGFVSGVLSLSLSLCLYHSLLLNFCFLLATFCVDRSELFFCPSDRQTDRQTA